MRIGVSPNDHVGEVADTVAHAARVFEIAGVDFCCKRDRTLREAAAAALLDADELLHLLAMEPPPPPAHPLPRNPTLRQVTRFVVTSHHRRARAFLVAMTLRASRTASAHSEQRRELWHMQDKITAIARELVPHMRREEQYLFPYIDSFESEIGRDETIVVPLFGTVEYPLQSIRHDHAEDLRALGEMRELAAKLKPQERCDGIGELLALADEFDRDLQDHIRLENDVLFPRAIEAERTASKRR